MKIKFLLIAVLSYLCWCFSPVNAQSITVVPNPNAPGIFAWTSYGPLSGYAGTPIILNSSLVLEYNATGTSDTSQAKVQLAVYTGGNSLNLIPNPNGERGVYFQSVQIVFNNKLFFIYLDTLLVQKLASFDGTSITTYPNPDGGLGYLGSPRIFNSNLYVAYSNAAGVTQFGKFNGSGITLIPNPDNSARGFFNDYSVVFNNKIVSRYITAAGPKQLATFDGNTWTLLPNPDNTATHGFQPIFPTAYHNKLYWIYLSATNQYQYAVYDGATNPTLIANPEDESSNNGGVTGFPIVFNDTLFFQYQDMTNVFLLAKTGGSTISLVPNPDATTYGFWNTPVVYNNNLYIFYLPADGSDHLTQYQGATNSLKVFPNPDGGRGYWNLPIVYGSKLFFQYNNAQSVLQLGYFDGNALKLISNPGGIYNGAAGNNGYTGYPVIWNNLLYMQFGSVPYGNAGNLAFIDASTLPITLINFTVQKNGNNALLQWSVANEVNNAYFSVEHSSDGNNFEPIGKVTGRSTVSTQQKYQFTDNNPFKGLNFYRLKQVDYDGNYTYSDIVSVNFENLATIFKIFPNPATNSVNISMPLSAKTSVIAAYDFNGKKVLEKQISANTVSEQLDVSKLAAGVYQLTLKQGEQQQTVKLVKE